MFPPRVPQFNWIDLGLPSGTLWLDRAVGAPAQNAAGLFYQWGSIVGHTESENYDFSQENWEAQGLNLITSDLNDDQDAARAYYGPAAKMPTSEQASELLEYTTIQRSGHKYIFTSVVNGHDLVLYGAGWIDGTTKRNVAQLRSWLLDFIQGSVFMNLDLQHGFGGAARHWGSNIMAVHS